MIRRPAAGFGAVATALITACGPFAGGPGAPPRFGGPDDDALLIGSYGEILALSGSRRMVFAAAEDGVAMFDLFRGGWLPPLTRADGFPAARFTTLSAEPERDVVWIGAIGEVLSYDPAIDLLIRAIVPGRVERIFFDRDDPSAGAYVAAGGTWTLVAPSGVAFPVPPERLPPPTRQWRSPDLDDIYREHPSLRSFATLLTRDASSRAWPLSAGTRIGEAGDAWVGTLGGGMYVVDPLFNRARHVPYGLFERGASALALAAGGVWIGSEGRDFGATGGVALADVDLQRWEWLRGPPDGTMTGARVNDLVTTDGVVWAATSRGVARRELVSARDAGGGARDPEWTWIDRSDAVRAWALAPVPDGVWVGTDRGLALVRDNAGVERIAGVGEVPVRALARSGDSLWIGSDAGLVLLRVAGGARAVERSPVARTTPALDTRIRALAFHDSLLAVATDDAVVLVNLRARSATLLVGSADARTLAPLTGVALDASSVWIAGDGGLLVADRTSGAGRLIRLPIPPGTPVRDVVVDDTVVWLATSAGLVRLRKEAYR